MTTHRYMETIYSSTDASLYLDKSVDGYLNGAFLHLEINVWSVSKFKLYLRIWGKAQILLRDRGYTEAYTLALDEKEKLIKMFGFKDTDICINKLKLLRKELTWPPHSHL